MKLGEMLSDMIRYGDIEEAPWPEEWLKEVNWQTIWKDDPELYYRLSIAASILKLMNKSEGGSWSVHDDTVRPFLNQEVNHG
jgi:hypothetical protein